MRCLTLRVFTIACLALCVSFTALAVTPTFSTITSGFLPDSLEHRARFGESVGVDGDFAIIGAPFRRPGNGVLQLDGVPGLAYLLERDPAANTWARAAALSASDATACDGFGSGVAIHGNIAIVGARKVPLAGCPPIAPNDAGRLYVFERVTSGWVEVARLHPPSGGTALIGHDRLAFDGRWLVVSAQTAGGFGVFIYERHSDGSWSPPATLLAPATNAVVNGPSVDVSGDTLILGGGTSSDPATRQALADVFEVDASGVWHLVVELTPGGSLLSIGTNNARVSVDGSLALVSGFVHERDASGNWVSTATLPGAVDISEPGTAFGTATSTLGPLLQSFQRSASGIWNEISRTTFRADPAVNPLPVGIFDTDGTHVILTALREADGAAGDAPSVTIYQTPWWQFSNARSGITPFIVLSAVGNRSLWNEQDPARWSVIDDGDARYAITTTDYTQLSGSRLGEYALVNNRTYGDFTFTAEAKSTEDLSTNVAADYAVVFGYQDANNYYYVMFNSAVPLTELFKVVNGQRVTIASANRPAFIDNEYHTIEVARSGALITASVGGVPILSGNDATFGSGQIGIGSFNDGVRFDDVVINTPETNTVTIEAEAMSLSGGYSVELGFGRIVLPDQVDGYATRTFAGPSGTYDIDVSLISGDTGLSVVALYVNGQQLGYLYYDFSAAQHTLSIPSVSVASGDFILLRGFSENSGGARVDRIVFTRQ